MKMKKKIIIPLIVLVVLAIAAFTINRYLPDLSSYFARRITGSYFAVSEIKWSMEGTTLRAHLSGVSFKDRAVEATVKDCDLAIDTTKGLHFNLIKLSDLNIRYFPSQTQDRSFSLPIQRLEITRGNLSVDKEQIFINSVVVENINIGKHIRFKADVNGGRYFKSALMSGQGSLDKGKEDISGQLRVAGLNLNAAEKTLKGLARGEGTFRYKEKKVALQVKAAAAGFELMDYWLKKPIKLDKVAADVSISWADGNTNVALRKLFYKEIPFTLDIQMNGEELTRLELTSGFVDVVEVAQHATSNYSLQDLWDALDAGVVKAKRLLYEEKTGTTADLEYKGVGITYRDMYCNNIIGSVFIDGEKVLLKNIRGMYKTSTFSEVNGVIPYDNKPVEVKGKYSFRLSDLPAFVDLQGVKAQAGTTDGSADVKIAGGTAPPVVRGEGVLKNGEMTYKDLSFKAEGSYKFSSDGAVTFSPLVVRRDKSVVTCRGWWNKKTVALAVKGEVETAHLHSLASMPFRTTGVVGIEGDIAFDGKTLSAVGDVKMDDLAVVIPDYLEKKRGVPSKARVNITQTDKETDIKEIDYQLGDITLRGHGHVSGGRITNGRVKLDVPTADKFAQLFLLPQDTAHGAIALDLIIDDMSFPLRKLPSLRGYVTINDGAIRLPGLANPLSHINLMANFAGTSFDIKVNKLICGKSSLKKGFLTVKGAESPKFSLLVDMEKFHTDDVLPTTKKGPWKVPLIPRESILGTASGDFSLSAKDAKIGFASGKSLEINGVMADRKVSVSELKMGLFDGRAAFQGVIDLAGHVPYFYLNGRLSQMKNGLLLEALGSTTTEIVGRSLLDVNLKSEGDDKATLINDLKGTVIVFSRDGVIKKWNILSKIFSFLNLYDMLKGKINFAQSGLAYTKMGAVLTVKNGVFHTNNFLLDSPSMVITGAGDIDANKSEINGSMVVSPLIAIDRTIDKLPIIRNILKKRGQGFLYLTYNLEGPLEDPQISPSITGTLGSKTIEILRNILVLPKEVFE